ncbi:unnamed protein product [Bursaphelenchus xylophilus]|nr:unnamed protein product [Bursaphelenchus xylophilus]CAG9125150.1 unnamed protein product [Bursaphelenchus xylophilus]
MIQNARVGDALAKDGHNVTVMELEMDEKAGSLNQVKHAKLWPVVHDWPERPPVPHMDAGNPLDWQLLKMVTLLKNFLEPYGTSCSALLRSQDIMNQIRDSKFDVIMFEQFDYCPFFISHVLDIKVKVWMSSCPVLEHQVMLSGIPSAYSYSPIDGYSDKMNFWQRFLNMVASFAFGYNFNSFWGNFHQKLVEQYGPSFPNPLDLARTADLLLINTDELIDFPRALPPNVIHIGGIGMQNVNTTLPVEYEKLMQNGRKGVIYFSFGSIVSTEKIGQKYMKKFLDAFKKFDDYFFIVKISNEDEFSEEYAKTIENVKTAHWVPQPGVLAHPRLRLFITHGGYNGIMEASQFAVPLLSIGMFGDQPRNSKLVERNGWGLSFDKTLLLHGTKEFEERLREMLENPKYKKNALRTAKLLRTKPQTGEQRLLSYIRFLEENDGHLPELRSILSELSTVEYYNLDVWLAIVVVATALILILGSLIIMLAKYLTKLVKKDKME